MLPTSSQAQLTFPAPIAGLSPISFSPFPDLGVPGITFGSNPVDEFNRALHQVISQDVLHIEHLAKRVQDGINRAYEPDVDPSRTAADLTALRNAMLALYATLKQSGLGAIPLATSPQPEPSLLTMAPAPGTDPRVEEMMKKVQEVYKHGQASREAAAAGLAVLRSR